MSDHGGSPGRPAAPPAAVAAAVALLLLATAAGGCRSAAPGPAAEAPGAAASGLEPRTDLLVGRDRALLEQYFAAIFDAAVFRPERQVSELVTFDGPATVVAWRRCACAACAPCPATGELQLEQEVWVTAVPEVRRRCRGLAREELVLRLEQLLGLPPWPTRLEETFFVEMRVPDLADLFRPCTDPDPRSPGPCTESFPPDVDPDHVRWLAEQMLSSWRIPEGYPWTRLGYTYDWAPEAASVVGPSEFLVRAGARIEVLAVVPTAAYCGG